MDKAFEILALSIPDYWVKALVILVFVGVAIFFYRKHNKPDYPPPITEPTEPPLSTEPPPVTTWPPPSVTEPPYPTTPPPPSPTYPPPETIEPFELWVGEV
jgi:hypothetical protein